MNTVMMLKGLLIGAGATILCGTAFAGSFFPFYDNLKTDEHSFFAVRPFYSKAVAQEGQVQDFLWPLYSRKSFKDEQTSRALIFWWTHNFSTDAESPRIRNWLLPFYFQGRDKNNEPYFALFPLGGTIHEFLGRDKISFALFPIVGKSQINDVKTTSVLWPVYSRTRGDGIRRDRVFPIIGKSVLENKYEKRFVLWPFWTSADYFYPGDSGTSWILFPICGHAKMDREKTLWVIPPFFRFTKGDRQNRLDCPWPFIQKIDSEKRKKLYIWPLWGTDQRKGISDRTFLFWPLLWSERTEQAHLTVSHKRVLPFFSSEEQRRREPGRSKEECAIVSKGWKIWPLMSWQRAGDTSRFRMLELWPIKNSAPIERNWSPLWTLYKRTNQAGVIRKDLLWFTWHSEKATGEDRKEWSLLKGLLSYKKEGDVRSGHLFWFNVGRK